MPAQLRQYAAVTGGGGGGGGGAPCAFTLCNNQSSIIKATCVLERAVLCGSAHASMHRLCRVSVGSYDAANADAHLALLVIRSTTTAKHVYEWPDLQFVCARAFSVVDQQHEEGRSSARTLQFCFWLCAAPCMACPDSTQQTSSDTQHDCQMPACRLPLARVRWWWRLWRAVRCQCAAARS